MITVTVNGTTVSLPDNATVADVAALQGLTGGAAIAVNDKLVRRSDWDTFPVTDGAVIIIIKAAYGG